MKTAPCKDCGATWHTKSYHTVKPRKAMRVYTPIKKVGRVGKETNAAMAKFKRQQKPNHQQYYECHYCLAWIKYIRPEHTDSRARSPKDRTNLDKMVISCDPCNEKKGSKSHDEFCTQCD